MPNIENETTIQMTEGEKTARVWSCQTGFHAKMKRLGIAPQRKAERNGASFSAWYEVPVSWVKIRPPKRMNFTDEQRKALGDRLQRRVLGQSHKQLQGQDAPISKNTAQGTQDEE